jgi:metal-responsive CopG/Arc/MetJ family transcriptional regulator
MVRINITLPESLLEELKAYCEQNGLQISELLRILIRHELKNKQFGKE